MSERMASSLSLKMTEIPNVYRTKGEMVETKFVFVQSIMALSIGAAVGAYENAPTQRRYHIEFHGLSRPMCVNVNGRQLKSVKLEEEALSSGGGIVWNKEKKLFSVYTGMVPVGHAILIQGVKDCPDGEHQ